MTLASHAGEGRRAALSSQTFSPAILGRAALPVVQVTDTIKRSADGKTVSGTEDRRQLFAAQTPQGFAFAEILDE